MRKGMIEGDANGTGVKLTPFDKRQMHFSIARLKDAAETTSRFHLKYNAKRVKDMCERILRDY